MSERTESRGSPGIGFALATSCFAALFFVSIPACWALDRVYHVDPRLASNLFYLIFILVYLGILVLPWLDLPGQEQLTRAQRLEKTCIAWLCLEVAAAVFWSGPWLVIPHVIVAAKGKMWAYGWWAYMAGGDARYTVTDASLIAMERMGIFVAAACAVILVRRFLRGRFTDADLWALIFVQLAEFGTICVYFLSAFYLSLATLGGPSEIAIKYVGSNIFWFAMPPIVFFWANRTLMSRHPARRFD